LDNTTAYLLCLSDNAAHPLGAVDDASTSAHSSLSGKLRPLDSATAYLLCLSNNAAHLLSAVDDAPTSIEDVLHRLSAIGLQPTDEKMPFFEQTCVA